MNNNKDVMKFDYDYFLAKFESIPAENFFAGSYFNEENPNQMCVLGHCNDHLGDRMGEAFKLRCLAPQIINVNDNNPGNIKESVLAYIKQCKEEDAKLYV